MRKVLHPVAIIVLLLVAISITMPGCAKKVAAPPPAVAPPTTPTEAPPTPPAPTITFAASPAAIERGQSSTLSWRTANATEVSIDGGIGTVEATGTRTVTPTASTTYRARATGPGGTADAEVRITVNVAEVIPPAVRPLSDTDVFNEMIKDVFFDYDQYNIRGDAREVLMQNARALNDRRGIRITIEGHCDERGSEKYNLALGDKRANEVKSFLVAQGIDPGRIDIISYGEERPFAPGHDEEAWRQNRRAHFVMR